MARRVWNTADKGVATMITHFKLSFCQITEILMQSALAVSAVCGQRCVSSDMVYSLYTLSIKTHLEESNEPYYIAIREQGTEGGSKEQCIERCKTLGYPLVIAKIERDKVCGYNMTITFTHGWANKDNNYMKQEFDSL